jgi:hypothetical protein
VAIRRITTENAPFSDRNKSFQAVLKVFEIASVINRYKNALHGFIQKMIHARRFLLIETSYFAFSARYFSAKRYIYAAAQSTTIKQW